VAPRPAPRSAADLLRDAAETLPEIDDAAFAAAFDRFAEGTRVVLLGEATHGTSEFYRARAAITRRLVERHGFTILAVEADWPDAAAIDRYVRHRPKGKPTARAFERFPTWMWRNTEVAGFVEWLRAWNGAARDQVGFHGLDLYSLNASIAAVLDYLDRVDAETARVARERYACLTPWQKDPASYGRAALREGHARCERAVLDVVAELLRNRLELVAADGESFLDAAQNAHLVAAAERYYRAMYYGGAESWNLRDTHMFETLERLLAARGPQAKAVVWAHNSHIGNAAATEMGVAHAELNIGELARERFGEAARLIGFGTDRGTVAAAADWGEEMQVMRVRPAMAGSIERMSRETGLARFLVDLRPNVHEALRQALLGPRLERAIGVVYRPQSERLSHYFDASLPRQFDAWVWFEETSAVPPLAGAPPHGAPDTWPFGL
jgi:erythromycin esterase-like protein